MKFIVKRFYLLWLALFLGTIIYSQNSSNQVNKNNSTQGKSIKEKENPNKINASNQEKTFNKKKVKPKKDAIGKYFSEEKKKLKEKGTSVPPSIAWQFTKTFIVLIFLLGGFWVFIKYILFKKKNIIEEGNVFNILHEQEIRAGKVLQFIEIGNKILLLGVSDAGIQLVNEITEKHVIDQLKLDIAKEKDKVVVKNDFLTELMSSVRNSIDSIKAKQKIQVNSSLSDEDQHMNILRGNVSQKLKKMKENRRNL